jgi:uncharacterized protein YqfA (UPF0365 family)
MTAATLEEAIAECMARGLARPFCLDMAAAQSVGGVYCDGSIVIDERGRRCVPRELVERVKAARAASPLPVKGVGVSPWLVGGAVAALVVAAFVAVRAD